VPEYAEKLYAVIVEWPDGDKRIFARIRRNTQGEVFVVYAADTAPNSLTADMDVHNSVHEDGRTHVRVGIKRPNKRWKRQKLDPIAVQSGQAPTKDFKGNGAIFATNADRAMSRTLPRFEGKADDVFEVRSDLLNGTPQQMFGFQLVQPDTEPAFFGRPDEEILAKEIFGDDVPWIVVRLVETSRAKIK
jgi:hypothetical protein